MTQRHVSRDGSTKLGLRLGDGRVIQSVVMPDGDRLTLCVSTQVGCGFGCAFCLTGTMGLVRNLTAGEIVGQVWRRGRRSSRGPRLTHVVFMGMGEPLANYAATVKALRVLDAPLGFGFSPRRITVSTVGLVQGLERLAQEDLRVNLAISLHAATDEVRSRLMPINRGWGLDDLMAACRRFPLAGPPADDFRVHAARQGQRLGGRRPEARAPAARGLRAKVNLIPFNEWPGAELPAAARGADPRLPADAPRRRPDRHDPMVQGRGRRRRLRPARLLAGSGLDFHTIAAARPETHGSHGVTPVTVAFATLGCKLNQYDTAEVQALLEARGIPDGRRSRPRRRCTSSTPAP